ncbi:hypothetical protein GGI43DRAFT_395704 [Trichoderma evansii]
MHAASRIRCQFPTLWLRCLLERLLWPCASTPTTIYSITACPIFLFLFHLFLSPQTIIIAYGYPCATSGGFGFSCRSLIDNRKFAAMTAVSCHASVARPGTSKPSNGPSYPRSDLAGSINQYEVSGTEGKFESRFFKSLNRNLIKSPFPWTSYHRGCC